MKHLKYNKEEIKEFQKALSTIIDDLDSLWKIGALEEIRIPVYLNNFSNCYDDISISDYWNFIMDESGYYLSYKQGKYTYTFAGRNGFGKTKKYLNIDEQDVIFIKEYQDIRKAIVSEIEMAQKRKKHNIEVAKQITEQINPKATIEIDIPETLNQHKLEVVEEDGKKVGTLNFGSISLKIITSGNVELVSKQETNKVKRK